MKPTRDTVRSTLNSAANDLSAIESLALSAIVNDDIEFVAGIVALARQAHDLLDVQARALGDPGFGFITPAFRERDDG